MNYRHAFHAGNHADVLKHIALLALIDSLKRKDTPFFVLDTHAGRGRYQLGGEESRKTSEADAGVLRLMAQPTLPDVVERYLRAVQADNLAPARPVTPGQKPARPTAGIQLDHYPGSPLLAAQALRAQDRMAFCELQADEAQALKSLFDKDSRVRVHAGDGYAAIRAFLPPRAGDIKIGRGLVLIDPPYEAQDAEYPQILHSVREALARWPQAICMVWYPIKLRRSLQPFMRKAAALPAKSVLVAELQVRPDDSPLRLTGSGLLIVNAPWQFDRVLAPALPVLKQHLGEPGASTRLEWLRQDA
ncbi:23S rRNA (adenine(2030)-N(6))-methyltransferase RlmJ [Xanthomonas sp. NCPPB 1067]|uniref:Ribosomal RNA large subunit methyltransferase J n=1 Tax=Xanthomonas melonis TaxID=56456 RepID=A0A2S7DFL3_9XANT|nr:MULTISPECIES: 23S rRNA (adenine(2030)-N(6))-methyltransferase RlmJ [Xanthomonas]MCC4587717.1 23S rRNA (adenine(2030)-N(6))-methyltransferase RlmJ [Xanthomonas sp. NCPPB 1067]MCC4599502.1 23S rRNA (adenine(2030)-N(6))-methyltransferase RlmJ [Xanthomonas melonis]PPU72613.1 23S rRNA (adenine(2030)-N(6))-methyltransferase RlmJ [Xanthomonas melonis]